MAVQYNHEALDFAMPPTRPEPEMLPYLQSRGAAALPEGATPLTAQSAGPSDFDDTGCSIELRPNLTLSEFRREQRFPRPVVFRRRGARDERGVEEFARATRRAALDTAGHDMYLIARVANEYESREMPLSDFLTSVVDPGAAPNTTAGALYFLGDVIPSRKWEALLELYTPPELVVRVGGGEVRRRPSFGLAGLASGAPWHKHGPGFAEVVHGRKRWYFYPPTQKPPGVVRGQPVGEWLESVLPNLPLEQRPVACTAEPGDVVFVPDQWFHATVVSSSV